MTWWTAVAGLTPLAAYDGARISGASLLDGVGSNNLVATSDLVPYGYLYTGVLGDGGPVTFSTPITTPAMGVIAAFIKIAHAVVVYSLGTAGATYTLYYASNGNWYSSNPSSVLHGAMVDVLGHSVFAAIVKGATTSQLYVNGVAIGGAVANSYIPASFDKVGENVGSYATNLQNTDSFIAGGFWSGDATQADVVALEAAARAELAGAPATFKGLGPDLGRLNTAPAEAMTSAGVVRHALGQVLGSHNIYFGGIGKITGTVKITPASPTHRLVKLYHEHSSILVAAIWSDAATGAYTFQNLALGERYMAIAFDYTETYRAVIADRVLPELM